MSSCNHSFVGNIVYTTSVFDNHHSFTQWLVIIWLLKILRVFVIFDETDETDSTSCRDISLHQKRLTES